MISRDGGKKKREEDRDTPGSVFFLALSIPEPIMSHEIELGTAMLIASQS